MTTLHEPHCDGCDLCLELRDAGEPTGRRETVSLGRTALPYLQRAYSFE